jgi:hypothetical protein
MTTTTSTAPNPRADAATVDPWEFLPRALAHWHDHPDESGVAAMMMHLYVALGLRECAEACLARIPAAERATVDVCALHTACEALPPSERSHASLQKQLNANLAVRPELSDALREHLDTWRDRLDGQTWYATIDGNIVVRIRDAPRDDPAAWVRFRNDRAASQEARVPAPTPTRPNTMRVLLDGMNPPWLLRRLLQEVYVPHAQGMTTCVHAAQSDPLAFLDALAMDDLRDLLSQPRLALHIGTDAPLQIMRLFEDTIDTWGQPFALTTSGTETRCQPDIDIVRQQIALRLQTECNRLMALVQMRDDERSPETWHRRFADSRAGKGAPIRVLMMTSRFTTYVQNAIRDMDTALCANGAETRVLIEAQDHDTINTPSILRTLQSFDPDIILMVNWMRAELPMMPKNLPFITWVQDDSATFHRAPADEPGVFDFAVGCVDPDIVQIRRFARERTLRFPVPASAAKFASSPCVPSTSKSNPSISTFVADVLIAMNHGESPARWIERTLIATRGRPADCRAIERLAPRVIEAMNVLDAEPLPERLDRTLREGLTELGIPINDAQIAGLQHALARPLATRVLRHRLVEWACELCDEHGWSLKLCGRGWGDDPRFARFNAGILAHGDALGAAYASSAVTLHASMTFLHQRVYECILAGGLPAMLFKPEDLRILLDFGELVAHDLAGGHTQPHSSATEHGRVRIDSHPALTTMRTLIEDLGATALSATSSATLQPVREMLTTGTVRADLRDDERTMIVPEWIPPADHIRMFEAMRPCLFRSREELGQLIARAINDPEARSATNATVRSLVDSYFTYEETTAAAIDLVVKTLTSSTG